MDAAKPVTPLAYGGEELLRVLEACNIMPAANKIHVVDVGANPIDEAPPYRGLWERGLARVTGFEPQYEAWQKLQAARRPGDHYHQTTIGDENKPNKILNICAAPGMTSTRRVNMDLMQHFPMFDAWGYVKNVATGDQRMLDAVLEILPQPNSPDYEERYLENIAPGFRSALDDVPRFYDGIDFLKIDVQGAELECFIGGARALESAVFVQTEAMFVEIYDGQPLFADQDQWLREHGFQLHTILQPMVRGVGPIGKLLTGAPFVGVKQAIQADVVYCRPLDRMHNLSETQLLKTAIIAACVYGSFDLAHFALTCLENKRPAEAYLRALVGESKETTK